MNSKRFPHSSFFWLVQAIVIPAIAGSAIFLNDQVNRKARIPELSNHPRIIRPQFDYPFVITDDQLVSVLHKVRPQFKRSQPKINFIDHALRLWGHVPQIDGNCYSGNQLLQLLTDHPTYEAKYSISAQPLLNASTQGIVVTTREDRNSVSHVDHLLGTLAEIGTPLSFVVRTPDKRGSVEDILNHAINKFSLNQREYEWTALALALYIREGQSWHSADGQELNFDRMARRIMRQRQPQGVCYGQHRLYTLVMMLRVNEQLLRNGKRPILSVLVSHDSVDYLSQMTRKFYRSQDVTGYWDGNWHDPDADVPDPSTNELSRRLLATGHVLEWWAMAPQEVHPPRETIVRAAQWLTKTIIEMEPESIEKNYTFLTHATRALVLWRGKFAEEIGNTLANQNNHNDENQQSF